MEITTQFLFLVPVIVGITQALKKSRVVKIRFVPLVSILLGILGSLLLGEVNSGDILQGIVAGLTACGLFSGVKATVDK